jgi:hypothetical protein
MMNTAKAFGRLLSLIAVCALVTGCGNSLDLASVKGVVLLDDTPVPEAFVVFTPKGAGRPSQTKTDEKGRFTLVFDADNQGALVGDHSVTVSTEEITRDGRHMKEIIPMKYNRKGSIEVTVKSGGNDFKLELVSGK